MRLTSNFVLLIVVMVTQCDYMSMAFQSLDLNQRRGCTKNAVRYSSVPVKIHQETDQRTKLLSSRSTSDMNDVTTSSPTIQNYQLNYVTNDVRMPLWTMMPQKTKETRATDIILLDTELWLGRIAIVAAVAIIVDEVTTHEGIVSLLSKLGTM